MQKDDRTDSATISIDDSKQNYAHEVFYRGKEAYQLLALYDTDACVPIYHGHGALPPHPVVQNALRDVADRMVVWGKMEQVQANIELRLYRLSSTMMVPALYNAILDDFAKSMPSNFDRADVTVHIANGVTHLTTALFDYFRKTNSHVLMFAPTYSGFLLCALIVCCNAHLVKPTSNGIITAEHIERALDEYPNAKGIFLVNPNNPTGHYFHKDELEKIARFAIKRDLVLIVDEINHKLVYDPENPFISMASVEIGGKLMLERTVTLRGVSKDHGLASARFGYAIGSKELMDRLQINNFTLGSVFNVDDFAQYAVAAALSLTPDEYYEAQQNVLRDRRDMIIASIEDINRTVGYEALKVERPPAGMFQVIDATGLRGLQYNGINLETDIMLFELLVKLESGGVAILPASTGGYDPSDMKLRLSLSSSDADLSLGMKRFGDFVQQLFRLNR